VVKPEVAAHKITRAHARLDEAEELVSRPVEEFVADRRGRDLASFYLQLAIQEVIDLAAHWVADAGWVPPADAGSTFEVLADHGVIDRELASQLRAAVGLRNRIAHDYTGVDHARLHAEFAAGVEPLRRFFVAAADAAGL
jgi:uncharacterized protein YutE (UPF0331/DUF86 family)